MATKDLPSNQFTYFSERIGVVTKWGPPSYTTIPLIDGDKAKMFQYSENGKYLVIVDPEVVRVYISEPFEEKVVIQEQGVVDAYLSPLGSYLVTWKRPNKENTIENLKIWTIDGGTVIASWKLRVQVTWPAIQWTADELVAGVLFQTGKVSFYSGQRFNAPLQSIQVAGLCQFSIAQSTTSPYKVAIFIPEQTKSGTPGSIAIYAYPQTTPVTRKNFFADSVNFMWNSSGSALLAMVNQEIDKTGKSYYGKKGLFLLHSDGSFEQRVTDESIHAVQWNPNGKEFAVIYGDMPDTKVSLFDLKCAKTADLAEAGETRNTLLYEPGGKVLCVGGFGSLSGNLDFWDLTDQQVKKVGQTNAFSTTYHEWCPDGRHFLAAVLSPRLRQDNGIKIYNYHGELVYEEAVGELWHVHWRPLPQGTYPHRKISPMRIKSPGSVAKVQVESKKYRHPHFTGSTATATKTTSPTRYNSSGMAMREPVGGTLKNPIGGNPKNPVGGNPVGGVPAGGRGAGRGRGKKNTKKPQQEKQNPNQIKQLQQPQFPSPQSSPQQQSPQQSPQLQQEHPHPQHKHQQSPQKLSPQQSPHQSPHQQHHDHPHQQQKQQRPKNEKQKQESIEKKTNILQNKLKDIEVLKHKQASGEVLVPWQVAKIEKEQEVLDQLKKLQVSNI